MSSIIKGLNESLADEIMAIAKAKGLNPRLRGTPEQERERTNQMLAQRAKDRELNPPPKPTLSPEQVQQLKQSLEQEQKDFDPYYEYSDDHGYWTKQKEKAQRIGSIKQRLKDAGEEIKESVEYKTVSVITEARTYKLWESAGQKLVEAQLTADQISQIFQYVQNIQTAGGDNRTLLGKGKDAASAVNRAWEDLKTKVSNSGPIKNVDALYDKAAEQLKQKTGGDQGVMSYVQKYRDFAKKHPVAQSLIYSALIAAAGISGAGLGGAAALGLFKMVDKLLQGEKFSSAAYSGAKTGAMAYGASKIGDVVKGLNANPADQDFDTAAKIQDLKSQLRDPGLDDFSRAAARQDLAALNASGNAFNPDGTASDAMKRYMDAELATRNAYSKIPVKESIQLTESQIIRIINKVTSLNEGIMDTLKGAAGKAANWAQTKGTNLTTKVTADKLLQAWKKAGSPTDSLDVASIIQKAGVPTDTITQVFNNMKIPAPGQQGGGADIKRHIPVDPSSVAPPSGSTTTTASTATTEPAKAQDAVAQSTPAKAVASISDYQKIKQLLSQLDKRGKMNLVKLLDKELAVTEDILSLTESELQLLAELSPETLASYKKKAGQSASQADKEGNYKLGDKRFSGIVRATKKELEKDVAKHTKEDVTEEELDENLHKWFKEKWVRFGPDGKIRGACARGDDSEGKPKCLPQAKAHSLGKKGRKYAAAKKRREDPNPERRGPAKNVATKKKTNEGAAGGLNEFSPAGGGGNIPRGPKTPSRGPWGDSGEDPYQLRRYNRSIDFFDQFDSDGVDKQNFDKATGEYEGYYFDRDAASGITQIAYFKFDDPTKIGDNDPGVGWYYEPIDEGVAEGSVTPNVTVNKVYDDGHEKEWHVFRGKEMIGYVIKNQPDTAEDLYIAYGHGPGRAFVEEFRGLKSAVNYITSLKEGVAEGNDKNVVVKFSAREYAAMSPEQKAKKQQEWQQLKQQAKRQLKNFTLVDTDKKQGVAEGVAQNLGREAFNKKQGKETNPYNKNREADKHKEWNAGHDQAAKDTHDATRFRKGVAEEQLDELKCWPGYTRVQGVPAGAPGSCKKKTSEDVTEEKCPHCGGPMFSEMIMNEKKDACYYKVKSRYKVWPSAYASGALVKCRKKGASNWGTGGKK